MDKVFSFPTYFALRSMTAEKIKEAIFYPKIDLNRQFIFIENHDVERYASFVSSNPNKLRLGAIINLTLPGTPIIYYGQELGMKGIQGKWNSDGNDIPVRLAYRWTEKVQSKGSANFYRNSGPWDQTGFVRDKDGISYQEEIKQPDSLLNFYTRLIQLRKSSPALSYGSLEQVTVGKKEILAYLRKKGSDWVMVLANFSDKLQVISVDTSQWKVSCPKSLEPWQAVILRAK